MSKKMRGESLQKLINTQKSSNGGIKKKYIQKNIKNGKIPFVIYLICKWIKISNSKADIGRLKKHDPFICCLQQNHFRFKKKRI